MKKMMYILIITLLIVFIFIFLVIFVDSLIQKDKAPSFFGWKLFFVMTNDMNSEIEEGDIVIVKETNIDELKEGDIIASNINGGVIINRIEKIEKRYNEKVFETKYDNSEKNYDTHILGKQVEGVYQFKIGKLGYILLWMQSTVGIAICIGIPIILLIIVKIYEIQSKHNLSY